MSFTETIEILTKEGVIGETTSEVKGFFNENRWMSNFHKSPVTFNGNVYMSVEHAYQAAKAIDEYSRAFVANAATPGTAKIRGKILRCRADWEQVKLGVMEECLRSKFQDPILATRLRKTGEKYLEETNFWGDTFWGRDLYGRGDNHLGVLLMKIRGEISLT